MLRTASNGFFEEDTSLNINPHVAWDPMEPESVKPEADDYTAEAYDTYINAQVSVPIAGRVN